jgi:hypothetical protein
MMRLVRLRAGEDDKLLDRLVRMMRLVRIENR